MWNALITVGLVLAQSSSPTPLREDTITEHTIAVGEIHRYVLPAAKGRLVRVEAAQSLADVRLQLRDLAGSLLVDMNSPAGTAGAIPLGWIAENDGDLLLVVSAVESADGSYRLQRLADRIPDDEDRRRLQAQRQMATVRSLMDDNSAEALEAAIAILESLEPEWSALEDTWWRSLTLQVRGQLKNGTGRSAEALIDLQQSLALWSDLGDQRMLARTHNRLAETYHRLERPADAIAHLESALPLSLALGDQRTASVTANSLGSLEWRLGNWDAALAWYEEALPLRRATGYLRGEAITLNNIGTVYDTIGDYSNALLHYRQSLELRRQSGDRRGEAVVLNNIGELISNTGDPAAALPYLREALEIRRETGDPYGEVKTLLTLGGTEKALGLGAPRQRFSEALDLAMELESARMTAMAQRQLALLALEETRLDDAEALAAPARESARASGILEERLWSRIVDSRIHLARNDFANAQSQARAALKLAEELDLPFEQVRALDIVARAAWREGRLDSAIADTTRAVSVADSLRFRAALSQSDRRLRRELDDTYRLHVELLMAAHRKSPERKFDQRALNAVLAGRHRQNEALSRSLTDAPSTLQAAWGKTSATVTVLRSRLAEAREHAEPDALASVQAELSRAYADLEQLDGAIRVATQGNALGFPAGPPPLRPRGNERIIVLTVATDTAFAWVVSESETTSVDLGARKDLEAIVNRANAIVHKGGQRRLEGQLEVTLRELSNRIVEPLNLPIPAQSSTLRLTVLADGPLESLPLAALYLPGSDQRLIDRFQIVRWSTPSVRVPTVDAPKSAPGVIVFSSPQFDGELPALPNTAVEAEAIENAVGGNLVAHYSGLDATRSRFESVVAEPVSTLHLATHALIDDRWPELSSLVFSMRDASGAAIDAHLRVADLGRLQMRADLVVLSACSTVPGPHWPGSGLRGLARGFIDAGADTVVAGLWPLQDRVTAEFMKHFYAAMHHDGLDSAAALRAAQLAIRERYPSPWYWAGFVHFGR